jgi:ABC-type lipoprotein release transport system permease subunit
MGKKCGDKFESRIRSIDGIRVGLFLAWRQLTRAGGWTTGMIVFIMTLTFLNLTMVGGILLGLVEGSSVAFRQHYSGDLLIGELDNKRFISRSQEIASLIAAQPGTVAVSARYLQGARVEANWKTKKSSSDLSDSAGTVVVGINPEQEDLVTGLSQHVVDGRYLDGQSSGEVLIGSGLLAKYSRGLAEDTLPNVGVGDRVRLAIGDQVREVIVRGVVKSKIGEVDQRVFMVDRELRQQLNRDDLNVNEMAVKLRDGSSPDALAGLLRSRGYGEYASIKTWQEAQGSFFQDLQRTFLILSNFIGSIALAVAAITVFIVILINALSRKREIGIMKGIGICGRAITLAYILQALAYAAVGTVIGVILLFVLIKPYFDVNPIDFPFSDGILVATPMGTTWRAMLLMLATALAGWLPARGIIRQNTLDTILGR